MEANRADSVQGESTEGIQEVECKCSRVFIGLTEASSRNWKSGCPAHGLDTEYYRDVLSPRFSAQDARLLELYRKRREQREIPKELAKGDR